MAGQITGRLVPGLGRAADIEKRLRRREPTLAHVIASPLRTFWLPELREVAQNVRSPTP
jgi:hypothetical protein